MKSKVAAIIILSLLNIILVWNNAKNQISPTNLELPLINKNQTKEIIERYLNFKNKQFKIIVASFIKKRKMCRACLDNEIELLNRVNNKFHNYLLVFYEGDSSDLKNLGAQFDIIGGVNIDETFPFTEKYNNPITIIVDRNGFIQDFNYAITGVPQASFVFFNRIISLLQLFYSV